MATTTAAPRTKTTGGSFLLEDHQLDIVFTPEDFNEDQQMIAKLADEFATNEVLPNVEKIEHKEWEVTRELLKKSAEMGLTNADVPAEYGGSEMDKVSSAIIADRMAKCGSFVVSMGGHAGIGTLPLVFFGTEEQKKKYLPKLASAEMIGAYALSESTSGSDALNSRTKAVLSPDGKHYILNGEKMWITNAHFADLFTVFAKVDGEKFTAFLIEKDFPGFSVGNEEKKMGIAARQPRRSSSTTAKCRSRTFSATSAKAISSPSTFSTSAASSWARDASAARAPRCRMPSPTPSSARLSPSPLPTSD